jgi:hypothetical protein
MRTVSSGGTRVAAVMVAYDRRDHTLACLRSLRGQQVPARRWKSTSSTTRAATAPATRSPCSSQTVTVLHGDGELCWNGEMRRAFDYGLRAGAAGCSVWVPPGTIGTCAPHPERGTDELPSWGEELWRLWSRQQLQPGPWAANCRRWAGRLWPMYWLSPYARGGMRLIRQRMPLARRGTV